MQVKILRYPQEDVMINISAQNGCTREVVEAITTTGGYALSNSGNLINLESIPMGGKYDRRVNIRHSSLAMNGALKLTLPSFKKELGTYYVTLPMFENGSLTCWILPNGNHLHLAKCEAYELFYLCKKGTNCPISVK